MLQLKLDIDRPLQTVGEKPSRLLGGRKFLEAVEELLELIGLFFFSGRFEQDADVAVHFHPCRCRRLPVQVGDSRPNPTIR